MAYNITGIYLNNISYAIAQLAQNQDDAISNVNLHSITPEWIDFTEFVCDQFTATATIYVAIMKKGQNLDQISENTTAPSQ